MNNAAMKIAAPEAEIINFTPQPMRGIKQAVAEIKAADPCTALTVNGLRALVNNGTLPCVRMGRKILVNMRVLDDYLYNGAASETKTTASTIRRISEVKQCQGDI